MFYSMPSKKYLQLLAKLLVLLLTIYLLYHTIHLAPDTYLTWGSIVRRALESPLRILYLLAALLIPINWGFEARKWQLLGQKIEPISYLRAYRSVMVGLTLGFITPNRLGDYAGRVLELKSRQRLEALGAIFIGRFCQLVATVLAGSLGLLYFILRFYWHSYPGISLSIVFLLGAIGMLVLVVLYHANVLVAVVAAIKPLQRLVPYVAIMSTYSSREMSRLLLLSLGRYAVFLLQFVLLLILFEVHLSPVQYISGVSGTFYLKSVVPSVSLLSDLGVRELSAMYLFGLLGQARLQVLSASLSLWLLNIALPSAAGLVFVLRLRLVRKGIIA
ncbi:lysylphosphatidylglycerol synthase domain-containing protein [Pontibacter chitinilyticus]|uniref:lysylphosphatidylglycerol synthase domain-containing protein n=1 Tax=Pontibacter chitinilyticus TaxID=2674989 RepID=UPI00321BCA91